MATTTVSRNALVGLTSLSFIRPIQLSYKISGTKPGTRLYAFFDGKSVDQHITPDGGTKGQAVVTDESGNAIGVFDIPPMTFNTGDRVLKFQDSSDFNQEPIPGAVSGYVETIFSSAGLLETYQETITNTTDITRVILEPRPTPPRNRFRENGGDSDGGDPLAQTFFTYGIRGGCFITKIDIFFQNKDGNIPVTLQIREVTNGYPSPISVSKDAVVTLTPDQVNLSTDASVATTFEFPIPIYLEENRDYCFVLMSNSNNYYVYTSEIL